MLRHIMHKGGVRDFNNNGGEPRSPKFKAIHFRNLDADRQAERTENSYCRCKSQEVQHSVHRDKKEFITVLVG